MCFNMTIFSRNNGPAILVVVEYMPSLADWVTSNKHLACSDMLGLTRKSSQSQSNIWKRKTVSQTYTKHFVISMILSQPEINVDVCHYWFPKQFKTNSIIAFNILIK